MLVNPFRITLAVKVLLLFIFIFLLCTMLDFGDIVTPKKKQNNSVHYSTELAKYTSESQPTFPEKDKSPYNFSNTTPINDSVIVSIQEVLKEWVLDNENIPYLPVVLRNRSSGPQRYGENCAKYPDLYTIRFSNTHWQVQQTALEEYYLYAAYLDTRGIFSYNHDNPFDNATVRILGMSDRFLMKTKNSTMQYCQYWFEHKPAPVFAKVTLVKMIWNPKWGSRARYFPYLITCELPPGLKELPVSVSVVPAQCTDATNNLGLIHRNIPRSQLKYLPNNGFGVCVKALDLPDKKYRERLAEWIETIRVLGADKIFFYELYVHPEIKRLLDYYENKEVVSVAQTSLPGAHPNQAQLRHFYIRDRVLDKRMTELIPYNDCLLRNMNDYRYIAVLDIDEIIMPGMHLNWKDMHLHIRAMDIPKRVRASVTSICFRNYYFMDKMLDGQEYQVEDIPKEFHMLRHVFRSKKHTDRGYMKCLHSTREALAIHNHFTLFCRDRKRCVRHFVNAEFAQLNHYRSTCVRDIKNCTTYILDREMDTKIWRYEDEVIDRVQSTLNALER